MAKRIRTTFTYQGKGAYPLPAEQQLIISLISGLEINKASWKPIYLPYLVESH
jgi:hypothetical protein